MGILRDFERRLEGAVEGFFARAFRSGLQPVELAKAVQRYAGNYQQVGVDGVFVPNVYRFDLSHDDMERFSGFATSLQRELADVVVRTARERNWGLQGPVRIEFKPSDEVAVGTYELRGKVEAKQERPPAPQPRPRPQPAPEAPVGAATQVLPTTEQRATLRVVEGPGSGRRMTVRGRALIGRLPECEVTLDDPSVSRRHARVTRNGSRWTIEDLDSTNGVRINGKAVQQAELRNGDRLELGSVHLTFSLDG